jgi:hypothetical protein
MGLNCAGRKARFPARFVLLVLEVVWTRGLPGALARGGGRRERGSACG